MKTAKFWIATTVVLLLVGSIFYKTATMAHVHQVNYDTYISIVLTALAVTLAALALLVGVAAIYGYQQISTQAESHAEKAIEKKMKALLSEANVDQMIRSHVEQQADQVYKDIITTAPTADTDTRRVADSYPQEDGR